jgi:hypothetical protein
MSVNQIPETRMKELEEKLHSITLEYISMLEKAATVALKAGLKEARLVMIEEMRK